MKIYYWVGKPNFGDLLSSLLIKKFTRLESVWSSPEDAELILCGSIIEHMPHDWAGVIAGCGKLHEKTKINLPNAKIIGVRGPLTAKGLKGEIVLGDPGLLANELIRLQEKQHLLGIVPHWTDKTLEYTKIFQRYNPLIIRPDQDPLEVIKQISSCEKIVSSSLHGIILADALNIPRRIEIAPRMLSHSHQEGGLFKWHDYLASINMKLEIGITREADRNVINDRQSELYDMMQEIKTLFR